MSAATYRPETGVLADNEKLAKAGHGRCARHAGVPQRGVDLRRIVLEYVTECRYGDDTREHSNDEVSQSITRVRHAC